MKKILVAIVLVSFSVFPVAAQVAFGVRAGGAYSAMVYKIDDTAEAGARFGYNLALTSDIPLWNEFSLRPELAFVSQGGNYMLGVDPSKWGGDPLVNSLSPETKIYYHYYSLQVPVNICYTFTFSEIGVNLFGGPVADFSLFGKKNLKDGPKTDIEFGKGEGKDLKPFDFGINIGLGAEYSNFTFSIATVAGLINRRADKEPGGSSVYQNNVTLSLGYYFRTH